MKTQDAIQAFIHNRTSKNLRPRTIEWYKGFLGRFAHFCPELPMDPEPIEGFLTQITGEPETKHAYFRCLKAFYRFFCKRQGYAKRRRVPNPMELIDPPRCPKKIMPTLEAREMMQILNLANNLRDRALISIFLDSGGRVTEIINLRRLNISEDTVKVSGKTGEREIPISDETRRLLLALAATKGAGEYVFTSNSTNKKGQPLTRYGVYWIVRAYMKQAGIQGPKLGAHRIRHAFGKGYLVNGGDLRSLQEIMGHRHISTTQKYASLNLKDVVAKHHRFTPLRSAHAAAQESLFDKVQAIKEAEAIVTKKDI